MPHPDQPTTDRPRHRLVATPAGRTHLVEQGEGPLVLLLHGFPETWYSWRRQLPALAAAGYHAVAIDIRGHGRSGRPADPAAYRMLDLVADNLAVLEALGEREAVVVGHDVGATIAADSVLLRPDVFTAVAMLSVPYAPRGGPRPTDLFAQLGGGSGGVGDGVADGDGDGDGVGDGDGAPEEFYVGYFQQPGRAEAEFESDVRSWLAGFYTGLSGDTLPAAGEPDLHFVPRGGRLRDRFPTGPLPGWLSEDDLDVYAGEFERTGLTGALNRYRNFDRDWSDLAPWTGVPLARPSLFLGGARDASTTWMADVIKALPATHLIADAGHWLQQERPDEVNALLLSWLEELPAAARRPGE
jgi:pimeloyl-ACP methyl ester carboxylesterase